MKRALIATVALIAACASPRVTSEIHAGDAERAIGAANSAFSVNLRERNIDRMVNAFYSEDAIVMPPNAPAFRGRDAIKQLFTGFTANGPVDVVLTTDQVIQSCDDMATEIGHYTETVGSTHDTGKYVVTWRKIEGQWRAIADIFNSNGATR